MTLHLKSLAAAALTAAALCGTALAGPAENTGGAREAAVYPPGTPPTTYDIVVDKFGNRVRGSSGASVFQVVEGRYIAEFPVDVTACTYVATLGRGTRIGGADEAPGYISVVRSSGFTNGVFVETRGNFGRSLRNRPFHLLVAC